MSQKLRPLPVAMEVKARLGGDMEGWGSATTALCLGARGSLSTWTLGTRARFKCARPRPTIRQKTCREATAAEGQGSRVRAWPHHSPLR